MHYEEALQHCIFRFVAGSHQYGTNHPDSDEDIRGTFIAPLSSAFDIFQTKFVGSGNIKQSLQAALEAIECADSIGAKNLIENSLQTDRGDLSIGIETVHKLGADEELQELRKFLKLAAQCNPNILEFLYVEHLIDICTPQWEKIREHRHLFLSKKAKFTYAGYSISQMKRIKFHRGYLLHPPSNQPTRKEFGLPENSKIPKEHQNALLSLPDEWIISHAKEEVLREKQYASALQIWSSYKKWEKERNPARKEMERKWGYDVKHACHLIRIARSAVEILRDGILLVKRPDAEELKEILRGEWKYEQIEAVAECLDTQLDALYKTSPLREAPDLKGISALYREICEEKYGVKL